MSNQFHWIPAKLKFRFELTFHQMVFTKHEIISVLRITNWNYTLVKIFLISPNYSWQLVLFHFVQRELSALKKGDASGHQLLLEICSVKMTLAAKKFLVECVKDILDNNSSVRYILIVSLRSMRSMIASLEVSLVGNMHPIDYTL